MNIITPKEILRSSGENTSAVLDGIVDELARLIIMVETGRRHYRGDGERVANPEPFFTKTMDFCSINMYVNKARLIVLAPKEIDFNHCIALLIGRVNNKLHDLDAALGKTDVMFKEENAFASTTAEYVRTVDSLIMPKGTSSQVMKRVFTVGDARTTAPNAAFRWEISKRIQQFPGPNMPGYVRPEAIWFADKADIYVNLVGSSISRFSSHEQFRSIDAVLQHFGVKKIIRYKTVRNIFMREDEKQPEVKYDTATWDGSMDHIKVQHANIELLADKCMHIKWKSSADTPDAPSSSMTGNDFFNAFMERSHELGALIDLCQMCNKRQCDRQMYALKKYVDLVSFGPSPIEYAVICRNCMCNDHAFIDISRTAKIVAYFPKSRWSDVCQDHGYPRAHALLFESDSFRDEHKLYARDEARIAFNSMNVTLATLRAIEKFMLEVPEGEFLVFTDRDGR
jgi:hypothetical protein